MKTALLALLFAVGYATASPTPTPAPCDHNVLGQCVELFSDLLGVPVTQNSTAFTIDYQKRSTDTGYHALEVTCTAQRGFENCLADQYETCTSLAHLKKLLAEPDAYTYAVYASSFQRECSPDLFPVLDRNIVCLGKVYESHGYNNCVEEFNRDFNPDKPCPSIQQYADCLKDTYTKACSAVVGVSMCSVTEAGFEAVYPQCDVKCE